VDDFIRAFMQMANYKFWLKDGPTGKGPYHYSLKLKATTKCGDPEVLAAAMKVFPRAIDIHTQGCVLEAAKLFGCTKCKLYLPLGIDCNSHIDRIKPTTPLFALTPRQKCHVKKSS
jgi:hypothetical protein